MISKKLFAWNFMEEAFPEVKMDYSYNAELDVNVIQDGMNIIPAIVSDIVFRRTMTKTMIKKETDDQDP